LKMEIKMTEVEFSKELRPLVFDCTRNFMDDAAFRRLNDLMERAMSAFPQERRVFTLASDAIQRSNKIMAYKDAAKRQAHAFDLSNHIEMVAFGMREIEAERTKNGV